MKTILLGSTRYFWADILKARREQKKAARQAQPTLFELREDARPVSERTASGRFGEPSFFDEAAH
jgi:hypothetical protein